MNFGKYLFGIREEYFSKVSAEERKKQFFAYNLLAAMFFVLVFLAGVSGFCYGLLLFHNWFLAAFVSALLGGVSFVLLLLVLFLNMTTNHQEIYAQMTDMSEVFRQHYNEDLSSLSDEEAQKIVQTHKMKLRERNLVPDPPDYHVSTIFVSLVKLSLILVLSCVIANGIEVLMFKDLLNDSFARMLQSPELQTSLTTENSASSPGARTHALWASEMLMAPPDRGFGLVNCQSIMMIIEVLYLALGKWKITLDLLFYFLYLIPFMLVKKSRRYSGGVFLKEVALADISTSYMAFLLSLRKCQQLKQYLENDYNYDRLFKKNS